MVRKFASASDVESDKEVEAKLSAEEEVPAEEA